MAKNLEELRDDLYTMFNEAKSRALQAPDLTTRNYPNQAQACAAAIQAAAKTAESILLVEREIADRDGTTNIGKLPSPPKAA